MAKLGEIQRRSPGVFLNTPSTPGPHLKCTSVTGAIRQHLEQHVQIPHSVTVQDDVHLGTPRTIKQALTFIARSGMIVRVSPGVYVRPLHGDAPTPYELSQILLQRTREEVAGLQENQPIGPITFKALGTEAGIKAALRTLADRDDIERDPRACYKKGPGWKANGLNRFNAHQDVHATTMTEPE